MNQRATRFILAALVAGAVLGGIALTAGTADAQGRRRNRATQPPAEVRPMTQPIVSEFVFPPHPKHNHSSCIVEAPNGDLLVCWYRGSGERWADDVAIMGSRKRAGSDRWEEPFVMADVPFFPDTNPILFVDPRGQLWLFWALILDNQWASAITRIRTSTDYLGDGPPKWAWQDDLFARPHEKFADDIRAGIDRYIAELPNDTTRERRAASLERRRATLEEPIWSRLGWMPRLHPIMYTPTKMLVPLYGRWGAGMVAITEDWGQTWRMSRPMVAPGASQPALVRKADGGLVAYLRDGTDRHRVHMSTSADGGESWSEAVPTDLPNPGSSVEAITLRNGHWLMVHNDVAEYKGRYRLAVRVSTDEGMSWSAPRYLENDPRPDTEPEEPMEYSYASAIQTRDGLIHVSHTWKRREQGECIKHVAFDEAWVTGTAAPTGR